MTVRSAESSYGAGAGPTDSAEATVTFTGTSAGFTASYDAASPSRV